MNILKVREELLSGKTIYDIPLRVADYSRVSTDKDIQLNSLENQKNYFTELIESNPTWIHTDSYIDEGISGTTFKRENFLRMIDDARNGKLDLILTKEISRFSRNTIDSIKYTELLLSYGVAVLFISDNINTIYPDSEFRLTLMASLAQDEVRKLSERVKFGIKRSIKEGRVGGSCLTGYTKQNGKLKINPQEAHLVKLIFNLYATGQYSFKEISTKLAEQNYYTKKGKNFSETTLKKILTNPRYKGFYTANLSKVVDYKTHRKESIPKEFQIIYKDETGAVPAIISESLWNQANQIYLERKKHWNSINLNKKQYLNNQTYTSKLFCQEHHKPFIRAASSKRKLNPTWQCNEYLRHGKDFCESPIIKESKLNELFLKDLSKIINFKELKDSLLSLYTTIINNNQILKNDNLTNQKSNLLSLLLKGIITEEEYLAKKQELNLLSTKVNLSDDLNKIANYLQQEELVNSLGVYFNIFVNKVIVSKIDNNRKKVLLDIDYNYPQDNMVYVLDLTV